MVQLCLQEAKAKGLRPCDFWGGFALDEMKIQVVTKLHQSFRVQSAYASLSLLPPTLIAIDELAINC